MTYKENKGILDNLFLLLKEYNRIYVKFIVLNEKNYMSWFVCI